MKKLLLTLLTLLVLTSTGSAFAAQDPTISDEVTGIMRAAGAFEEAAAGYSIPRDQLDRLEGEISSRLSAIQLRLSQIQPGSEELGFYTKAEVESLVSQTLEVIGNALRSQDEEENA